MAQNEMLIALALQGEGRLNRSVLAGLLRTAGSTMNAISLKGIKDVIPNISQLHIAQPFQR
jgi:hypothetical protein